MKAICTFVLVACLYASGAGQCPVTVLTPNSPLTICDETPNNSIFWNEALLWDSLYASHDLAEAEIPLDFKYIDSCGNATVSCELMLDMDGDGNLETIIIPDDGTPPGFFKLGTHSDSLLLFDLRPVQADDRYQFSNEINLSGDTVCVSLSWNTPNNPLDFYTPELPYGSHLIRWVVNDGGAIDTTEWAFSILDCGDPTIVCINGLSTNILPNNIASISALDILQFTLDNVTPSDSIEISIEKSADSTGDYPLDTLGNPVEQITFNCTDLGTHQIRLWARDLAGNSQFCESSAIIQDNGGNCGNGGSNISICAFTECGDPIDSVAIEFYGSHPLFPPVNFFELTNSSGCISTQLQALPIASNYTLSAYKDKNHLNGVTTFDLVLISKHILGLEVLPSPYKMIAADANKSNSLTTFDIVELRKLILGIYYELPNNTSWRLLDKSFTFSDPENPFLDDIPESIDSLGMFTDSILFLGVKVGDVNCSANGLDLLSMDDRQTLPLNIKNQDFQKGELLAIPIFSFSNSLLEGAQLALNWDIDLLSFQELSPGKLSNLNQECFALPYPGELRMSWVAGRPESISEDKPLFILRFQALKDGELNGSIELNDTALRAEAYSADEAPVNLQLFFQKEIEGGISVYSPYPNPGTQALHFALESDHASESLLRIHDGQGRLIHQVNWNIQPGFNQIQMDAAIFSGAGLYFWNLKTATSEFSGKIIRQ